MKNDKIKVFHVVPSLNMGGREKILLELVKRRNRKIFDTRICCLKDGGVLREKFQNEDVEVISFQKKGGIDTGLYLKLGRYFKEQKADIIHSHNPGTLIYSMIGALIARVPVIVNTEHGYEYPIKGLKGKVETLLRNLADINITVSKALEIQISKGILSKKRVVTILNGVEPFTYGNTMYSSIDTRKKLGLTEDVLVVGNVARLAPVKNHRMLLDAMKILLGSLPNARLLLVGDGELRKELENYVRSVEIDPNVLFIGHSNSVPELLNAIDVFAMSSLNEGISITILEAMASGKPVVATEVGGNPEIVKEGETGVLVPSNRPDEMAKALLWLMKNREKSALMGLKARKRVEEVFNINLMVKKTEELYLSLYNRHIHE